MATDPVDAMLDTLFDQIQELGLTQKEVARRVGCSEKHLSQVLTATTSCSTAFIRRVWKVLEEA